MFHIHNKDINILKLGDDNAKLRVIDESDMTCEEVTVAEFKYYVDKIGISKFRYINKNSDGTFWFNMFEYSQDHFYASLPRLCNPDVCDIKVDNGCYYFLFAGTNKLIKFYKLRYKVAYSDFSYTIFKLNDTAVFETSDLTVTCSLTDFYYLPNKILLYLQFTYKEPDSNKNIYLDFYLRPNDYEPMLINVTYLDIISGNYITRDITEVSDLDIEILFEYNIKDRSKYLGYLSKLKLFGSKLIPN